RRRYLAKHPDSYLSVTRAPEDQPPGEQWNAAEELSASRAALHALVDAGAFSPMGPPRLYLYRLSMPGHSQVGIVGGIAIDDYDSGLVRVHEQVRTGRVEHLTTQLDGLGVQSSPIALAHRDAQEITSVVERLLDATPAVVIADDSGLSQQVWAVDDDAAGLLCAALADQALYLVDGHHRAAAASLHFAHSRPGNGAVMLGATFPANQLRTEAFHRVLTDVDSGELLERLRTRCTVRPAASVDAVVARSPHELALLTGGRWWLVGLALAGEATTTVGPLDRLDPVRLQQHVLAPLLDIEPSSASDVLDYRPGLGDRDDVAAIEAAMSDRRCAIWVMRPVPVDALIDISDAGLVMPPKSTCFVPKVRSGVFLRSLS
ncbi:MAG: DUF1015 domain-containing protein, partial [Acidimicrobiia bacterium]|nr:DUF1015 domain-containing protein [Acidimicrobiia bacterium]